MSVSAPGEVDAGPELEFSGPEGTERLTGEHGSYSTEVIGFLLRGVAPLPYPAGRWSLAAPGGRDIAPFSAGFMLPPVLNWNAVERMRDPRDLEITWDTGGLTEDDSINVSISHRQWAPGLFLLDRTTGIVCRAPALEGRITIPSSEVRLAAARETHPILTVNFEIARRTDRPILFELSPPTGGRSGAAIFTYRRSNSRVVEVRR